MTHQLLHHLDTVYGIYRTSNAIGDYEHHTGRSPTAILFPQADTVMAEFAKKETLWGIPLRPSRLPEGCFALYGEDVLFLSSYGISYKDYLRVLEEEFCQVEGLTPQE